MVWSEALQIETADVYALPYVMPYWWFWQLDTVAYHAPSNVMDPP
jgi:hypothetical protein